MRLGSSTDKKDSGRLHVDFAQARDDFYEWECKQRMRAREERHRRKLEEDRLRPPSPPAIMHYSEHEAALLAEKLKGKEGLQPESACPSGLATDYNEGKKEIFCRCQIPVCPAPAGRLEVGASWSLQTPGFHQPARDRAVTL